MDETVFTRLLATKVYGFNGQCTPPANLDPCLQDGLKLNFPCKRQVTIDAMCYHVDASGTLIPCFAVAQTIDVEGSKFRVLLGTSPEEVAIWRAERRKRWPTAENKARYDTYVIAALCYHIPLLPLLHGGVFLCVGLLSLAFIKVTTDPNKVVFASLIQTVGTRCFRSGEPQESIPTYKSKSDHTSRLMLLSKEYLSEGQCL